MPDLKTNVLYYGDNLEVLRGHIPDGSVDLIYLDPPFNSQQQYNVLFREPTGQGSTAQIRAFTDTWHWDMAAEKTYQDIIVNTPMKVSKAVEALRAFIGANDVMAYLVMMTLRLVELHRVLKLTGSLYLHCDPTASHYLKVILDTIFGPTWFRNEIVWKRSTAHADARQGSRHFGRIHDVLLRYTKTDTFTWTQQYTPYEQEYIDTYYKYVDEQGRRYWKDNLTAAKPGGDTRYEWGGKLPPPNRYWAYSKANMERLEAEGRIVYSSTGMPMYKRYLDEMAGKPAQDIWDDIRGLGGLGSNKSERLGYQTQKPLALLERIISASSNEGDVVLDPFCGCGTAIIAAQKLNRRWIGIDVTHLAIGLIRRRMSDAFPGVAIEVIGEPVDIAGAQELATTKPKQFEYWAVDRLNAHPTGGRGPDLDGVKPFVEFGEKVKRAVISVKGTKTVNPEMIREVLGAMSEDKPIGVLLILTPPTPGMLTSAAAAGFYESSGQKYPKVQIITVLELLAGKQIVIPGPVAPFARAPRERKQGRQGRF